MRGVTPDEHDVEHVRDAIAGALAGPSRVAAREAFERILRRRVLREGREDEPTARQVLPGDRR